MERSKFRAQNNPQRSKLGFPRKEPNVTGLNTCAPARRCVRRGPRMSAAAASVAAGSSQTPGSQQMLPENVPLITPSICSRRVLCTRGIVLTGAGHEQVAECLLAIRADPFRRTAASPPACSCPWVSPAPTPTWLKVPGRQHALPALRLAATSNATCGAGPARPPPAKSPPPRDRTCA